MNMNKKLIVLGVIILSISVIILTSCPPGSKDSRGYPRISNPGVGSMIVITTTEFQPAVEPLVKWKNRKGIRTRLYIYPGDTGPTPADIKAFIKDKNDSYYFCDILIVGETHLYVQNFAGKRSGEKTQLLWIDIKDIEEYKEVEE